MRGSLHAIILVFTFVCIVWDVRSFKKPVATRSNVLTLYPTTNAIFSPDNRYVLTGAGATSKGGSGKLLFLHRENLEVAKEVEIEATPVVVQWHPKINQVRILHGFFKHTVGPKFSIDRCWSHEWPNISTLFATYFSQWCQIALEQRTG